MSVFWNEYLYFTVYIAALLVCVSAVTLFYQLYRFERRRETFGRVTGFGLLGVAFVLFVLERKFAALGLVALVLEAVGLLAIYVAMREENNSAVLGVESEPSHGDPNLRRVGIVIGVGVILLIGVSTLIGNSVPIIPPLVALISALVAALTLRYQLVRYHRVPAAAKRQNLPLLLGYIALMGREVAQMFNYIPAQTDVVPLRYLTLDYSMTWVIALVLTLLGFAFIAQWIWQFIKVRFFLRTYVIFLTIIIMVSSLGALVFTLLSFQIVEANNIRMVVNGSQSVRVVLEDRSRTATFISSVLASDPNTVKFMQAGDTAGLQAYMRKNFVDAGVDQLVVYDRSGEVLASPADDRDRGTVRQGDKLLDFVLGQSKQIQSYDTVPGVLSPTVVVRSLYPVLTDQGLVGAVEVGYRFDNAFADFIKKRTNLDTTIYAGNVRSATTVLSADGVSRWVGSTENDSAVVSQVLNQNNEYGGQVDLLGQYYYAGFQPLQNADSQTIGMVSVSTLSSLLLEATKQQLLTTFLFLAMISLGAAFIAYWTVRAWIASRVKDYLL